MPSLALSSILLAAAPAAVASPSLEDCRARHEPAALRAATIEGVEGVALDGAAHYRVRGVQVVRQPIFGAAEAENNAFFRLANRWHADTREGVIRAQLLFREGETVNASAIAESERLLRARPYLYDARIVANRRCGSALDVVVVTRDVWALLPSMGVARSGGEQTFELGLSDANVFGRGATFGIELFDDLDRRGFSVGLSSAHVAGSRLAAAVRVDDANDGGGLSARIGLPFYALDARRAWGLSTSRRSRDEGWFQAGRQAASFTAERQAHEVWFGWSDGLQGGFAKRWRAGLRVDEHRFAPLTGPLDNLAPRAYAYPWASFERVQDAFAKTRNLRRLQATEDVFVGRRFAALVGYSPRGEDRVVFRLAAQAGGAWRDGADILRYGWDLAGAWDVGAGRAENVIGTAWLRHRRQQDSRRAVALEGIAIAAEGLSLDRQLLLGGDAGLRGYPNRFQAGDRLLRLSAERRYYSSRHWLRVLRIAAAGFVDVGAAWYGGDEPTLLANVGVGLRFESTRTSQGTVYHLDMAKPLVDGPGVRGMEVTLAGKRSL